MEEMSTEQNNGKKRVRVESESEPPGERRVDSEQPKRAIKDSDLGSSEFNRVEVDDSRVNPSEFVGWDESGVNSPELNGIPDDILDILDEPDPLAGAAIQDLDSFIKSFEEEILHPSPSPADFPVTAPEHGESRVDLGYLLEASDDELGLPPTTEQHATETESNDLASSLTPEALGSSKFLGIEGGFSSYEPFGFGVGGENDDLVAAGGLFDYESADLYEFLNRPGSLHV